MSEIGEFKNLCRRLARESGALIRRYYRGSFEVELKEDESPVTIADRKAEELLREIILKECPAHGFKGEETGEHNVQAEYVWMIDPIDGTKSFISGVPLFGTLIALLRKGRPLLGVIHNPILEDLLLGDNDECLLNEKPARIRPCDDLSQAVLLCTDFRDVKIHQDHSKFDRLNDQVRFSRTWGDCYGYAQLAAGFADVMIDPIMSPWDTMALIPVIQGAGGVITDFQGGDATRGNSIIAAGPRLHGRVLELLN